MFKMTRDEKKGDRSRKQISMPREQVRPVYGGGMVTVQVKYKASAARLKRLGFRLVLTCPPDVEPMTSNVMAEGVEPAPIYTGASTSMLRKLASDRSIRGRSKMTRDQLLDALEG